MFQQTIKQSVTYEGIGLHSGKPVIITLKPAKENEGIRFCRTDLPDCPCVAAKASEVTNTLRATTLEQGEAKVFTVEHLLAALRGLGVDNCLVEMNSPEPPVADGSALTFVELIEKAGICEQSRPRFFNKITQEQTLRIDDRFITILPYDGFRITFTSVNPHPLLKVQFGDYEITPEVFKREIAPARTIGFMHEVEALKAQGLGLGGSLENVVVYDETSVLTPLRFEDELVRHKILDVIGDLALAGFVCGHVIAVMSGHAMNTTLARQIACTEVLNEEDA